MLVQSQSLVLFVMIVKEKDGRDMPVILGKSRPLTSKGVKEIRHMGNPEKRAIELTKQIAKEFGQQSKKMKPKKIIIG
ncbi:MAG TPA: hypothetical protein VK590_13070 [Saprospiraceae bacterium]|nr:hypothetical protein [Saprospiraceae bacterium]